MRNLPRGAAIAALVLATACGGTATQQQQPGQVTIGFVGPEQPAAFAPVISAFEAAHPTIKVKYTQIPFEQISTVLQQRLQSKDATIDAYTVDYSMISAHAARGFLADLSPLKQAADAGIIKSALDGASWRGKLWALPVWTSEQFLFYNKALLKKAGVQPPGPAASERWTWEQVTDAAAKAQRAGAKWGLLFDQADRYYQLQVLGESLGAGSGLTGQDNLTPNVATPGWTRAMTWYGKLFADGLSPRGVSLEQASPLFAAGKSAFFVGGPWTLAALTKAKLDYGIAAHPYFAGGKPATSTDSWAWGVNAASTHQAQARQFVEFAATTKQGSMATIEKIFIPPTNKEAFAEYARKLAAFDPPRTGEAGTLMLAELQGSAVHRPASIGYVQYEEAMHKAFADVRNGSDPAKVLQSTTQQLTTAFAGMK